MTGPELKDWRRSLKISQRDLAEKIGRSRKAVQDYEKMDELPKIVALACAAVEARLYEPTGG